MENRQRHSVSHTRATSLAGVLVFSLILATLPVAPAQAFVADEVASGSRRALTTTNAEVEQQARQAYGQLWVSFAACSLTVTTTADVVNPGDAVNSLREAIDCANATPGNDTINLPAGTYTTTLPTTNENLNANGDFDITGDTVITGAGQATVFVEAATTPGTATDRVFHIRAGAVATIQGLSFSLPLPAAA